MLGHRLIAAVSLQPLAIGEVRVWRVDAQIGVVVEMNRTARLSVPMLVRPAVAPFHGKILIGPVAGDTVGQSADRAVPVDDKDLIGSVMAGPNFHGIAAPAGNLAFGNIHAESAVR